MKIITLLLFPLFIGMIIGGFASGNTAMGVVSIILLVIDIILGCVFNFLHAKKEANNFVERVACVRKGGTAYFSVKEVSNSVVNLKDALLVLSREEYNYVKKLYDAFSLDEDKKLLDQRGFLRLCVRICSQYDLIGEYYRFCGGCPFADDFSEEEKIEYRLRAKSILRKGGLFSAEWQELQEEFEDEFYWMIR